MNRKLLVVVDMQNDFIDGALGTKEAEEILPRAVARILQAKKEGFDIVYTRDTHGANYLSTREGKNLPVPHCIYQTHGWQISDKIPVEGEIIDKPSFGSPVLAQKIKDAGYGYIEFIGVCTDICVISNALLAKAYSPESEICVRADCCAGVSPESHRNALEAMRVCQIRIL